MSAEFKLMEAMLNVMERSDDMADKRLFCEWCKKDQPHTCSGSGRKTSCQECDTYTYPAAQVYIRKFPNGEVVTFTCDNDKPHNKDKEPEYADNSSAGCDALGDERMARGKPRWGG